MSLVQGFIKPIDSLYFPYSKAVEGHTIPGILRRYAVRTVNYSDLTSALKQGKKFVKDPVTKFPGMNEDHGKGSSIMDRLKAALGQKQAPGDRFESFREGYERMREDLGWRGHRQPAPNVGALLGAPPAAHGAPIPPPKLG